MPEGPCRLREGEKGEEEVIKVTVKARTLDEQIARVHEATHIASAFEVSGETPNVHRVPVAFAYGESEEQALYRLQLKLDKVPVDAFGDPIAAETTT